MSQKFRGAMGMFCHQCHIRFTSRRCGKFCKHCGSKLECYDKRKLRPCGKKGCKYCSPTEGGVFYTSSTCTTCGRGYYPKDPSEMCFVCRPKRESEMECTQCGSSKSVGTMSRLCVVCEYSNRTNVMQETKQPENPILKEYNRLKEMKDRIYGYLKEFEGARALKSNGLINEEMTIKVEDEIGYIKLSTGNLNHQCWEIRFNGIGIDMQNYQCQEFSLNRAEEKDIISRIAEFLFGQGFQLSPQTPNLKESLTRTAQNLKEVANA